MSVQTSRQPWEQDVLAADSAFFTALVEGDGQALDRILADQFVLVGVNDGAVVPREALVPLVDQGQLRFHAIQADGSAVLLRRYGSTAIIGAEPGCMAALPGRLSGRRAVIPTCSSRIGAVGGWLPRRARRLSVSDRAD